MSQTEKKRIQKHFNAKAESYESSAVLQKKVCDELLTRLDYTNIKPNVILDVGCGTGQATQAFLLKYKKSQVISVDLSSEMLKQTKKKGGWLRKPKLICADAENIPLENESVDLIFSNLMLQWCDYKKIFAEFKRLLKPNGLLMFTTFGPDTLFELKKSWASVDGFVHVNDFVDMHDLGDELIHAGLAEPVMDMDLMKLTYDNALSVMKDLKEIGANTTLKNHSIEIETGLVAPSKLKRVIEYYERYREQGIVPASYEVIYGHAWKTAQRASKMPMSDFSISLDEIKR